LNLLFNPSLIDKNDVWQIDIVNLLEKLLEILKISGNNDLRVCGAAILTSSIIHRLKVESIFKLGKIANSKENNDNIKEKKDEEKVPIPDIINLQLPFRRETTYPVSLDELLLILENTIMELANPSIKKNSIDLTDPPTKTIDFQDYLIKFEKIIEEYQIKLFENIDRKKGMLFNDFVFDMNELDIARYFIAMLYLAMKQQIDISFVDINDIDIQEFDKLFIENKMLNRENQEDDTKLIKITVIDNQITTT
jgi:segregation and condensation protein A